MKRKINLYWKLPLKTLYILCLIVFAIPLLGILWIFLKFDIPFIHGGDRWIIYLILLIWWCACTILIFGWRIKDE